MIGVIIYLLLSLLDVVGKPVFHQMKTVRIARMRHLEFASTFVCAPNELERSLRSDFETNYFSVALP
jgi:hypothetical protein